MDKLSLVDGIKGKIYFLRGLKVMLDKDLAMIYGVIPTRLRQQVKRNKARFPKDFAFQLTEEEIKVMVSQNVIPSHSHLGGHLPYAFTEHGALMLASVLNSKRAVSMGIFIVRAFVEMREILSFHKDLSEKVNKMEKKYDSQFKVVFDAIKALIAPPVKPKREIGFLRGGEI